MKTLNVNRQRRCRRDSNTVNLYGYGDLFTCEGTPAVTLAATPTTRVSDNYAFGEIYDTSFGVSYTDRVFVTASQGPLTLLNREFTGYSSLSDLLEAVKGMLSGVTGLAALRIRNFTRGCALTRSLRLAPSPRFLLSAV